MSPSSRQCTVAHTKILRFSQGRVQVLVLGVLYSRTGVLCIRAVVEDWQELPNFGGKRDFEKSRSNSNLKTIVHWQSL